MRLKVSSEVMNLAMVSDCLLRALSVIILTLFCLSPLSAQKMENQSPPQTGNDKQCVSNLKRIWAHIDIHLHHSAGALNFSTILKIIYDTSRDTNLFICPDDKGIGVTVKSDEFKSSYDIVNDPLSRKLSETPRNKIAIIVEKRPNHDGKRFVLFYDGSVKAFDEAQYNELKSNSFIVRN